MAYKMPKHRINSAREILPNNSLSNKAKPVKLSIYDENDIPCYPIYEIFTDKFPDFICQICLSFVINPVECLTCNSIFCRRCLYEYTLYSKHCPNRCDINYRPVNRILKNIINSVKIPCIFFHKGCKEILTYEIYDKHIKQCNYAPYMCEQCYLVGTKEIIENHCKVCDKLKIEKDFSESNEKRFICRHCNLNILNLDEKRNLRDKEKLQLYIRKFLIHEYLCNEQIIFCVFCETKFRLFDFGKHLEQNKCLINQLNNKISYLTQKINYYESNIKDKKIINDEELKPVQETSSFGSNIKRTKSDIPYTSKYGVTQSLITNQLKIEEQNALKRKETQKNKEEFNKKNSAYEEKAKNTIDKVYLESKKFYNKKNQISSLVYIKNNNNNEEEDNGRSFSRNLYIIYSFRNTFNLGKDILISNKFYEDSKFKMNEIKDILAKTKYNKINNVVINNLISTKLNKKNDIFITTDSYHYFLFNNFLNELIQFGRPTNSAVTCCTEIMMPENKYYIVLGTISSNVQFLDPYNNKVAYILNHTKNRIMSLCYHSQSNVVITSSSKENAFYLWKYDINKDNFELRSTIKDNNNCIWSLILVNLCFSEKDKNEDYIITGGGDKTVNIWQFFPEENAVLKKLSIKEHHESVIKVLFMKIRNNFIVISGAFDGTIKFHSIKKVFGEEFDEIQLVSKELLTLFNQDSEILNLDYFIKDKKNGEEDNKDEVDLIVNIGGTEGYTIHKIIFSFFK